MIHYNYVSPINIVYDFIILLLLLLYTNYINSEFCPSSSPQLSLICDPNIPLNCDANSLQFQLGSTPIASLPLDDHINYPPTIFRLIAVGGIDASNITSNQVYVSDNNGLTWYIPIGLTEPRFIPTTGHKLLTIQRNATANEPYNISRILITGGNIGSAIWETIDGINWNIWCNTFPDRKNHIILESIDGSIIILASGNINGNNLLTTFYSIDKAKTWITGTDLPNGVICYNGVVLPGNEFLLSCGPSIYRGSGRLIWSIVTQTSGIYDWNPRPFKGFTRLYNYNDIFSYENSNVLIAFGGNSAGYNNLYPYLTINYDGTGSNWTPIQQTNSQLFPYIDKSNTGSITNQVSSVILPANPSNIDTTTRLLFYANKDSASKGLLGGMNFTIDFIDLSSSINHCGKCNNPCDIDNNVAITECNNGNCNYICNDPNYDTCRTCIDFRICHTLISSYKNDTNNCATCGNKCISNDGHNDNCTNGICIYNCFETHETCPTSSTPNPCATPKSIYMYDRVNCGGCGIVCGEGVGCYNGTCLDYTYCPTEPIQLTVSCDPFTMNGCSGNTLPWVNTGFSNGVTIGSIPLDDNDPPLSFRLIAVGGANSAGTAVVNDVYISDDYGLTWTVPIGLTSSRFPAQYNTRLTTVNKDIVRGLNRTKLIWTGGTITSTTAGSNEVWETYDGIQWIQISTSFPARHRYLLLESIDGSVMLVAGGFQPPIVSPLNTAYKSVDKGKTWVSTPNMPFSLGSPFGTALPGGIGGRFVVYLNLAVFKTVNAATSWTPYTISTTNYNFRPNLSIIKLYNYNDKLSYLNSGYTILFGGQGGTLSQPFFTTTSTYGINYGLSFYPSNQTLLPIIPYQKFSDTDSFSSNTIGISHVEMLPPKYNNNKKSRLLFIAYLNSDYSNSWIGEGEFTLDLTSTSNDVYNCGQCNRVCPNYDNAYTSCVNGVCTYSCELGKATCTTGIDTTPCQTNTNTYQNCGGCNNTCPTNYICAINNLTNNYACEPRKRENNCIKHGINASNDQTVLTLNNVYNSASSPNFKGLRVTIPNSVSSTSFSIWVRPRGLTTIGSGYRVLLSWGEPHAGSTASKLSIVGWTVERRFVYLYNAANGVNDLTYFGKSPTGDNIWLLVTGLLEATGIRSISFNGIWSFSTLNNGVISVTGLPQLTIGSIPAYSTPGSYNDPLDGDIDEIYFFTRILSQQEVKNYYYGIADYSRDSLVVYYPILQNDIYNSTHVQDYSGNELHAIKMNNPIINTDTSKCIRHICPNRNSDRYLYIQNIGIEAAPNLNYVRYMFPLLDGFSRAESGSGFSLSFWTKPDKGSIYATAGFGYKYVVSLGDIAVAEAAYSVQYLLFFSGYLYFTILGYGSLPPIDVSEIDDVWIHICLVYTVTTTTAYNYAASPGATSDGQYKVYINGVKKATYNNMFDYKFRYQQSGIMLGARSSTLNDRYSGAYDELYFYKDGSMPDTVWSDYVNGINPLPIANLALYWSFDDIGIIRDYSGNNRGNAAITSSTAAYGTVQLKLDKEGAPIQLSPQCISSNKICASTNIIYDSTFGLSNYVNAHTTANPSFGIGLLTRKAGGIVWNCGYTGNTLTLPCSNFQQIANGALFNPLSPPIVSGFYTNNFGSVGIGKSNADYNYLRIANDCGYSTILSQMGTVPQYLNSACNPTSGIYAVNQVLTPGKGWVIGHIYQLYFYAGGSRDLRYYYSNNNDSKISDLKIYIDNAWGYDVNIPTKGKIQEMKLVWDSNSTIASNSPFKLYGYYNPIYITAQSNIQTLIFALYAPSASRYIISLDAITLVDLNETITSQCICNIFGKSNCGPYDESTYGVLYNGGSCNYWISDYINDNNNCGSCGNKCLSGASCINGICNCNSGLNLCNSSTSEAKVISGGICANLNSNSNFCGSCSNQCITGATCNARTCRCSKPGLCDSTTSSANVLGNGMCRDFSNDNNNCGSCGNKCIFNSSCILGTCKCNFETELCGSSTNQANIIGGGICSNKAYDFNNCGSCGNICVQDSSCNNGICECNIPGLCDSTSLSANISGDGVCRNFANDPNNCGSCGNVCIFGSSCVFGICECNNQTKLCGSSTNQANVIGGGICYNVTYDPNNCGSCGNKCINDSSLCNNGICECNLPGLCNSTSGTANVLGNGICYIFNNDSNNCGSCNNKCIDNSICNNNTCICNSGLNLCNSFTNQANIIGSGICTDMTVDNNNCGECNNICIYNSNCISNTCICNNGFNLCNSLSGQANINGIGLCTNVTNNNNHCGSCNNKCVQNSNCNDNSCICDTGLSLCESSTSEANILGNGTCYNLLIDNNNCGSCGNKCLYNANCNNGKCECNNGLNLCSSSTLQANIIGSGYCTNFSSDNNNCGICNKQCIQPNITINSYCINSNCILECSNNYETCTTSSVNSGFCAVNVFSDYKYDNNNCGICNNKCVHNANCNNSICECNNNYIKCGTNGQASIDNGAYCIDYLNDTNNCGSCGNICPKSGNELSICELGICNVECPINYQTCSNISLISCGTYIPTAYLNDSNNCGSCTNACEENFYCNNSNCICNEGLTLCNNNCKDVLNDPSNCGICDNKCIQGSSCNNGTCECNVAGLCNSTSGTANILGGGICYIFDNDINNCGSCDNKCATGSTCDAGLCIQIIQSSTISSSGSYDSSIVSISSSIDNIISSNSIIDYSSTLDNIDSSIIDSSSITNNNEYSSSAINSIHSSSVDNAQSSIIGDFSSSDSNNDGIHTSSSSSALFQLSSSISDSVVVANTITSISIVDNSISSDQSISSDNSNNIVSADSSISVIDDLSSSISKSISTIESSSINQLQSSINNIVLSSDVSLSEKSSSISSKTGSGIITSSSSSSSSSGTNNNNNNNNNNNTEIGNNNDSGDKIILGTLTRDNVVLVFVLGVGGAIILLIIFLIISYNKQWLCFKHYSNTADKFRGIEVEMNPIQPIHTIPDGEDISMVRIHD